MCLGEDMTEPTPEIHPSNNPESRAGARDSTQTVARASDGGAPPKDALPAGAEPEVNPGGTAGGDPLAGLVMDEDDAKEAVVPKDLPMEVEERGYQAGH